MVMISYFEHNNITLKECMELFFSEKGEKSIDTMNTYYSAINNMSKYE